MGGPINDVVREILVRQLDAWGPAALHRSKRATFAQAYAGPPDGLPEAALRVFDEFTDLLRGRRLTAPVVAPSPDRAALDAVYQELDRPSGLDIHAVEGGVDTLPAVLTAANDTPLKSFAAGLRRDQAAIQAALDLPWTTSPVEGQISRIKMIKRTMYGRAGFDLLRARVLYAA